jgi:hypothetical protein
MTDLISADVTRVDKLVICLGGNDVGVEEENEGTCSILQQNT